MYETLKLIHVGAALLSVSGFALRSYWMLTGSRLLQLKPVRILPHIVDTILLAAGISLLFTLHLNVLDQPWLLSKLAALVVYIVLGTVALGRGKTLRTRTTAALLALAVFAYIYGVALNKSTLGWFAGL
jgi:uncharacterized membrane protein SirB2